MATGIALHALGFAILSIGIIFASLINATAKAPFLETKLTNQAFLGFAICEAMSAILLIVALLLLFCNKV